MKLNKKQILEYQKNRDPYLMVDEVENVEPGIYSKGYKQLKKMNGFLKCIGLVIQICQACYN